MGVGAGGGERAVDEMSSLANRPQQGLRRGDFPENPIKQGVAAQSENRGQKQAETFFNFF